MPLASRKRAPFKSRQADTTTSSPEQSIPSPAAVLESSSGTEESPTATNDHNKFLNVYYNHTKCGTLETTEESLCFWSVNPQSAVKTKSSRLRNSSIRKGALRKTFGCVWEDVIRYEILDTTTTDSDPGVTLTTQDGTEAIFTFSNLDDFQVMKKIMASTTIVEKAVCEKPPHLKVSFSDDVTEASSESCSSSLAEEEEEDFIAAHTIDIMTPKRLSFLSSSAAPRAPVSKEKETVDSSPPSKSGTKPSKMIPKEQKKKEPNNISIMMDTILAVLAVLILVGICLLGNSSRGPTMQGRSISVLQTLVAQSDTVETFVEKCLTEHPLMSEK